MPYLAYETDGTLHAGQLTGRALIGRRLSHGVVLDDTAVSRLHAWVEPNPDTGWTVTDAGSKNGLTVNGRRVDRQALVDGDVIQVGSTRITFHGGETLPGIAEPVTLSPPTGEPVRTSGVLFDCEHCASPIWVGIELVGKRGRCRHCKQQVTVPVPAVVERPAPTPVPSTGRRPQCGVCHAAIGATEAMKSCPECDTTFHAECWTENFGCSTYGCGQVDVLNPNAVKPPPAPEPAVASLPPEQLPPIEGEHDEPEKPPTQWEWLIVLGTLVASAIGAVAFGAPPLIMGLIALVMILRRRPGTRVSILVLAILIAIVGIAVGLAGSDFLYLNGAHLPMQR